MFSTIQTLFARSLHPTVSQETLLRSTQTLRQQGGLSPEQRLMIYRNNVTTSLIFALKDIYPVIVQILGDNYFSLMTQDYVWSADSSNPDLNHFGRDFPSYLEQQVQTTPALEELPYLPDLASLECAWHAAYYADDDPVFDFDGLAQVAQQGQPIRLKVSHSLCLLASDYPVLTLWKLHRYHQSPDSLNSVAQTEYYCLYRKHYSPMAIRLNQTDFQFLEACQQGCNLDTIASNENMAGPLSKIPMFIRHGLICSFEPE